MGVDEFERWWRVREHADIVRMIAAVGPGTSDDEPDLGHVRACAELEVALRRSGRRRLGSHVAHRLRIEVLEACRRTGVLEEDREGAARLARAAGDAARALVGGPAARGAEELFGPFRAELPLPWAS